MNRERLTQRIVLVGGGHTHAVVLRMAAMRPFAPGTEVLLVSAGSRTAYSGMLPGYVEGVYRSAEMQLDLRRLATASGAVFIHATATDIDSTAQTVALEGRPPLSYDLLSLDIGSVPAVPSGPAQAGLPVKPYGPFLADWQRLVESAAGKPPKVILVGGGAGGVELALAMRHRLGPAAHITLVHSGPRVLPQQAQRAAALLERRLHAADIRLRLDTTVVTSGDGVAQTSSGDELPFDALYWVTKACASPWLQQTGLQLDAQGFVRVERSLRCLGQERIFAAGDCAAIEGLALPKAGVFAVRQGPVLYANLHRALGDKPLRRCSSRRLYLAMIGTGDGAATATFGPLAWRGRWLWRLKELIDRRFMRGFAVLPVPAVSMAKALVKDTAAEMACRGCGAKVEGQTLSTALTQLERNFPEVVAGQALTWGLREREDTSLFTLPQSTQLLQSLDYVPSLVDDPFISGRLAAVHAFSDIVVKRATPHSAHVLAVMTPASRRLSIDHLYQTLAGIATELRQFRAELAGGHSAEGLEAAIGLTVNGLLGSDDTPPLSKDGGHQGDLLVLTKPLGTGVIFAAAMRGLAQPEWVDAALANMLQSHVDILDLLQAPSIHAATDVTGFGLAGHLLEMLRRGDLAAELAAARIPLLPGAAAMVAQGVVSSLFLGNSRALEACHWQEGSEAPALAGLWCDPQTCGGLLLSVAPEAAKALVKTLHQRGYGQAATIGRLIGWPDHAHSEPLRPLRWT